MKRRRLTRLITSASLLALIPVVISGCSIHHPLTPRELMTTPDDSIGALYDFYAKTVAALGQQGWSSPPEDANALGIVPEECSLSDGRRGVRYTDALGGPGVPREDQATYTKLVSDTWREWGLDPAEDVPSNPQATERFVRGENSELRAAYSAGVRGSSIAIIMACIPGNVDELTDGVAAHRASQSPPPTP